MWSEHVLPEVSNQKTAPGDVVVCAAPPFIDKSLPDALGELVYQRTRKILLVEMLKKRPPEHFLLRG